jgi:signal transduction histidine kinase
MVWVGRAPEAEPLLGTGNRVLTARWAASSAAAVAAVLIITGLVLTFLVWHRVPADLSGWDFSGVFGQVASLAVPAVGLLLAWRRPGNRIGWLFLAAGLALGLSSWSAEYALYALAVVPGRWPAGRAAAWLANWTWAVPFAVFALIFMLFPSGRPRSPRWRLAAWGVAGAFTLATADQLVEAVRVWRHPFSTYIQSASPPDVTAAYALMVAALVVSAAAVVVRFARSCGEERLQLKWFMAAAVFLVATLIPWFLTSLLFTGLLTNLAFLCLWLAIAIAILKYRLYGIDFVISKAVLYGSLAVFITVVYVGVVAGLGTLVGNRHSALLSALAAAVVAVAFQPVRQWAGRLASRVVYGRRATPYQVLSDFARRIGGAYPAEDVLPQMAQIVAAGTGAERVVVWLRVGEELRPAATSGPDGGPRPAAEQRGPGPAAEQPGPPGGAQPAGGRPVTGQALPALPDADLSVPVMHQGDLLGAITVRMPRDEPLRPAGAQLVTDVASQAGLVLSNAGLIEDLRASRQRLVTAQDETRRRLERNLHDGAQQDLVALALRLRLAGMTVEDVDQARKAFGELQADAAEALQNLRDLAHGIYPPVLADLGLAAALNAQAAKSPVPVTVQADGIGRFPQDTEAAVYFCCLEALQNVAKYAHATAARIIVQAGDGTLTCTVSDDGDGYDSRRTPMGSGQRNMADRLAALGGGLDVRSAPGQGTTVIAHLPVPVSGPDH